GWSGGPRRTSSSAMKPYSAGSGVSPARCMTASLPSARRPRVAPSIDPRASPSGFSWVTTRKRSCRASASTTASKSVVNVAGSFCVWVIRGLVFRSELVDQLRHVHAALDRRIVFEDEDRRPLQPQLVGKPALQEAVSRLEGGEGRALLLRATEDRHVDAGVVEVGRHLDAGD